MKIPEGMTEEQVVSIGNKVIKRLAHKFKFAFYDYDDIVQEAWMILIKGLEKYDSSRPLENFLWTHIKNRLCNFKRDNFERLDKPCFNCPWNGYDKETSTCTLHEDIMCCTLYNQWYTRNASKKHVLEPIDLDSVDDTNEENMCREDSILTSIADRELLEYVEEHLKPTFRQTWLKIKFGVAVKKPEMTKLLEEVQRVQHAKEEG